MALTGTVVIKKVTIAANTSVAVLAALGLVTAASYSVRVYAPQSESLNLSLADAAGSPTDPEAMIPSADNPLVIDSTSADVFLFNSGASSVTVVVMAWTR